MAKLNKKMQQQTENAQSSGFDPIPDGAYHVRLRAVDTTRSGGKGPYWSWEFEIVEPGEFANRRLWNNTSLSEAAAFKMKETFEAFGVGVDTDTDDMCGMVCKALVSTRVIQEGQRKGELANQVDRLVAADEDFAVAAGSGSGGESEDIFD